MGILWSQVFIVAASWKEREESCETTNLHLMNIYMQNTSVGICEIDDEIVPSQPANAAVWSWFTDLSHGSLTGQI